jgi:hypothetical protein
MSRYIDLDQIEFLKVDGNKEFNHGVDCCVNRLLKAEPIKAVSLDKVKQAREEIENEHNKMLDKYGWSNLLIALEILDKLIESEGKE